MKEVKKVSISGVSFIFDEDAYEKLNAYLQTLKQRYHETPDGEEIVADIEARIAELILTVQEHDKVVDTALVASIIRQMGSPEAIGDECGEQHYESEQPRIPRRLYRNPEGAKLGGVCSGLGTFFGVDPVWFRLAVFVPLLLTIIFPGIGILRFMTPFMGQIFALLVVLYILMWFAVPMAKTARQRLEMSGEPINASSISSSSAARPRAEQSRSVVAELVYVLGRICLFCLKVLAIFVEFALVLTVIGLVVTFFAVLFTPDLGRISMDGVVIENSWWWFDTLLQPAATRLLAVTSIAVVLLPMIFISYLLAAFIFAFRVGKVFSLAVVGLWIVAVVTFCVVAISNRSEIRGALRELNNGPASERIERLIDQMELDRSEVSIDGDTIILSGDGDEGEQITISPDGVVISVPKEDVHIEIRKRASRRAEAVEAEVLEAAPATPSPAPETRAKSAPRASSSQGAPNTALPASGAQASEQAALETPADAKSEAQ